MTITITGNKGEFICNIVIDGENGSLLMQDEDGIKAMQGIVSIKGYDKPMVKTKIIETTEKYDKDGKLVEKITREETSEDDTVYESGSIAYPQETTKSCCECKCELKSEDIIKVVNDYIKRTGRSAFCF